MSSGDTGVMGSAAGDLVPYVSSSSAFLELSLRGCGQAEGQPLEVSGMKSPLCVREV